MTWRLVRLAFFTTFCVCLIKYPSIFRTYKRLQFLLRISIISDKRKDIKILVRDHEFKSKNFQYFLDNPIKSKEKKKSYTYQHVYWKCVFSSRWENVYLDFHFHIKKENLWTSNEGLAYSVWRKEEKKIIHKYTNIRSRKGNWREILYGQ